MKQYYDLKKVVDPHQHMPKTIRAAFLDGMRVQELNNDTFINWVVGEHLSTEDAEDKEDDEFDPDNIEFEEDEDDEEDEYKASEEKLAIVDAWLLQHFDKDEEIIVLYWW